MYRRLLLASLVAVLMAPSHSGAQASGALITGTVLAGDGAPIASASVVLRGAADTARVASTVAAADGAFRIEGATPGSYRLEVSRLGFRPAIAAVTIARSDERLDVGVISLEPGVIAMEALEVSAQRAPIATLGDRTVYRTSDMPAAGTATDVLRSIPELEVSVDGAVTARGAVPSIHINGRPAPMQGEVLDRYLQQLPAERVERIEVIPEPSARHEAEGEGGIVNIVMKKGEGLGGGGSVAANAGTRNQRGGSGSIHHGAAGFTLFGGASASFAGNDTETSDLRENLSAQPVTSIQRDSRNHDSGELLSVDLSSEVKVGSNGAFWTDVSLARTSSDAEVSAAFTHFDHRGNVTERYDRATEREVRGTSASFVVGLGDVAGARRGGWSVELRRSLNGDDDASTSTRERLDAQGTALDLHSETSFAGAGREQRDLSLSVNLERPWTRSGGVEIGYRGSRRETDDDLRMELDVPGGAGAEEVVGAFRHGDRIHAAFLTARRRVGRFRVQGGLRGEQAEMRRDLPLTGDRSVIRARDLFPSANVSTSVGSGGQLRLSYSRRVDRPWGRLLNPATPILDPLNRQVGNPYLEPRYTQSVSLTASRSGRAGSLQLAPFHRRTVNAWDQVRTVDASGASTVTWTNLATVVSYGGNLTGSLIQRGAVGGFVSVRGYREVRSASDGATDLPGASTRFSMLGNLNVRATSGLNLQGTMTYLPPREVPQGRISRMVFSTLGVRADLWDGRGAVQLTVIDPLELQRFTFVTRDPAHVQTGSSRTSARRATIGFNYSFGRPPEGDRRRRTPAEAEQERELPRIQ
jgi:ferric enterobactin receptor